MKKINHQQVADLLTQSSRHMDDRIAASLRDARTLALQRQRVAEPAFSLAAIGHRAHNLIPHTTHQRVALAILLAAIIGVAGYWQNAQTSPDDIDILTDELPIEVFVDQ